MKLDHFAEKQQTAVCANIYLFTYDRQKQKQVTMLYLLSFTGLDSHKIRIVFFFNAWQRAYISILLCALALKVKKRKERKNNMW